MQRSTTLVARQQWWKNGIPSKTAPAIIEDNVVVNPTEHNAVCETVTENAATTGSVKVLSSEESEVKNHFNTRRFYENKTISNSISLHVSYNKPICIFKG